MSAVESLLNNALAVVIALVSGAVGWIWRRVEKLDDRVDALAIRMAGHYMPRNEIQASLEKIDKKLDKISDAVAHKVDK